MASRGWQGVTEADLGGVGRKRPTIPQKRSKYRNVKVAIDGQKFDSKREADVWLGLLARERGGEISDLKRQVPLSLYCPDWTSITIGQTNAHVATYVADYTYYEAGRLHVVDAKGVKTAIYQLKKKWLKLQSGIDIIEV